MKALTPAEATFQTCPDLVAKSRNITSAAALRVMFAVHTNKTDLKGGGLALKKFKLRLIFRRFSGFEFFQFQI